MSKDELRPAVAVAIAVVEANKPGTTLKGIDAIEADRAEVARLTEQRVVDGIVAWLRGVDDQSRGEFESAEALADRIEAGEWKQ